MLSPCFFSWEWGGGVLIPFNNSFQSRPTQLTHFQSPVPPERYDGRLRSTTGRKPDNFPIKGMYREMRIFIHMHNFSHPSLATSERGRQKKYVNNWRGGVADSNPFHLTFPFPPFTSCLFSCLFISLLFFCFLNSMHPVLPREPASKKNVNIN